MKKTVDFIEAVNSGKRFKPTNYKTIDVLGWCHIEECRYKQIIDQKGKYVIPSRNFYNAQFELEEKTIEITKSEFDVICDKFRLCANPETVNIMSLKKALGF